MLCTFIGFAIPGGRAAGMWQNGPSAGFLRQAGRASYRVPPAAGPRVWTVFDSLKMGHRAAKKGHRPAFFAPMYPPHHPRGVGGGLGPAR